MRVIALIVRAGAVVAASAFAFSLLVDGGPKPATAARPDVSAVETPAPKPKPTAVKKQTGPKIPEGVVAIVATGDIVMGSTPNLPSDGGRSFFADVQTDLAGDVVLGNLEGTLSTGGGSKCGKGSTNCFAFQTPPAYAHWLQQAGFTVLNLANNHAYDFGAGGLRQTTDALAGVGLEWTGRPGQITLQRVAGIRVALVGFAPYPWAQSLNDITAAKKLVRKAARSADVAGFGPPSTSSEKANALAATTAPARTIRAITLMGRGYLRLRTSSQYASCESAASAAATYVIAAAVSTLRAPCDSPLETSPMSEICAIARRDASNSTGSVTSWKRTTTAKRMIANVITPAIWAKSPIIRMKIQAWEANATAGHIAERSRNGP